MATKDTKDTTDTAIAPADVKPKEEMATKSTEVVSTPSGNTAVVNSIVTQSEHWWRSGWRPFAAWIYVIICAYDFMVGQIMLDFMSFVQHTPHVSWDPLTLKGAGTFHLAFGSIISVTAWQRGQEKKAIIETLQS